MTDRITRLGGPFHYLDLEDTPEDNYRREIIGGSLVVTPAPNLGHQRAAVHLVAVLLAAETPTTLVLVAPFDWRLPDGGLVEPDLLVIQRADGDQSGPLPASATPLLVVEILSPSNRPYDLAVKRDLYQRLAVPAYWIIDADQPSLLALRMVDGSYQVEAEAAGDAEFVTGWPFPVHFRPSQLRD